jgi:hypothetical protein
MFDVVSGGNQRRRQLLIKGIDRVSMHYTPCNNNIVGETVLHREILFIF